MLPVVGWILKIAEIETVAIRAGPGRSPAIAATHRGIALAKVETHARRFERIHRFADLDEVTSARVAREERPIATHEPPTVTPPVLRHRGEQVLGLLIGERKQGQFFASIERGVDPRRPTAKPSGTGVE